MAIFKKKTHKNKQSEYAKLEEERVPNHWTFNDDPLLNMEPVFSDQIKPGEDSNKVSPQPQTKSDKLASIKDNLRKSRQEKVEGPLGHIINGAIKKSQDIQNQVIENDPVIAKLHKIEELRKTGGVDDSVYTDVNKIKANSVSYSERAKKYHEKNSTVVLETELDRVKRLSKISKSRVENKSVGDYINRSKFSIGSISKEDNKLKKLESKVKETLELIKEKKQKYIDDEVNMTLEMINSMTFENDDTKEEFLVDKINEFNKLLNQKEKSILIKPRRKSTK
ncbi:hypothetical protein [Spiroplasma turonicum]|uniref:Uncharacterized protein n=1 Tax=Spiroplasma turonicum TaxID=216946 RepID=A0A0K1P532_9MOLU|nr:hypothetical protein [Spiroplasma turonicum]AKU79395.1 hypothetical protein STURON_00149 [Spiroplasma turonicum]ALX70416.1 hypothetical protein STURO_v1c01470 [Spiroplasma turonicum]